MLSDLKSLLKEFEKQYKVQVATIGIHEDDPTRLMTDIFAFDLASGGGFPEGRCSVVYGPEASMKTTLCLKAIAEAQRKYPKKKAVFVDIEGVFSAPWATKMGVDCDKLVYALPDSAEQFVDMTESLMYATDVSVIVCDSLAALVTTHELSSSAEKAMVGTTGIIINKFYRKIGRALTLARREGHKPTIICINQIRSKIGGMHSNAETMPGGRAFKFASSLTVRVYGKDEMDTSVDKVLPTYKRVDFVLKKWKVPVVQPSGVFLMALQPVANLGLNIGDSYDWNTVVSYLKAHGLLTKHKDGWQLLTLGTGELEVFAKQSDIKQHMVENGEFDRSVKNSIIKAVILAESIPAQE